MARTLNYALLIENMNMLDTDEDCVLSKEQLETLNTLMPISKSCNFIDLAYKSCAVDDGVPFHNVFWLYKAWLHGMHSKPMCKLLFRGADSDKDCFVNMEEFVALYLALNPDADDISISNAYNKTNVKGDGKISYRSVAHEIFHVVVKANSNPYKGDLEIRSPFTGCCNVI